MERQKEGTKTWVIASIFLLFGIVLALLIINSGITGNALINLPSADKTSGVSSPIISAQVAKAGILSGETSLAEICRSKTTYSDAELSEMLAMLSLEQAVRSAVKAGASPLTINYLYIVRNKMLARTSVSAAELEAIEARLIAEEKVIGIDSIEIEKARESLVSAKTRLIEAGATVEIK